MKIKQGDTVEVIRGKDLGMRGTVRVVDPKRNKVIVEGVNIAIKHQRPIPAGRQQTQGGRIEVETFIDASKVMLICPSCQERTRVGYRYLGSDSAAPADALPDEASGSGAASGGLGRGHKVRICKKCNADF